MRGMLLLGLFFAGFWPLPGWSQQDVKDLVLQQVKGPDVSLSTISDSKATVFVLLAPECPISQQCTRTLNELEAQYSGCNIACYGVFPGSYYSREELARFAVYYHTGFPLLMDTKYRLTRILGGTVTPEVFLCSPEGQVYYSGAIDDAYRELGRKNARVAHHYLADALEAICHDKPVSATRTRPIGCLVEPEKVRH